MLAPKENKRKREPKEKSELSEKLVHVNRVAKVVKGGRRFAFAALVVVGDGKGKIGFGSAKAKEVPDAVLKATHSAKAAMIHISMKEGRTLHHDIVAKFGAGKVIMRTAKPGTGVIAGGAMRAVFEVMGIQDVVAKSIGSTNPHNLVRATLAALKAIYSPKIIAKHRGKNIGEIVAKKFVGMPPQDIIVDKVN
ncbi:30S ribosomal protein S5 [Candidatus Hepatincolaceae symbiont of Richtersius coronifer]